MTDVGDVEVLRVTSTGDMERVRGPGMIGGAWVWA